MLTDINWTEVIVAGFLLVGTLYGHWKTAKSNHDDTIKAVRDENQATTQAVRDEIRGIREESQAKDEELHAGMELLAQQTESGLTLIRKDITTLSEHVEKHNSVIERTFRLEGRADAIEGRLDRLEK